MDSNSKNEANEEFPSVNPLNPHQGRRKVELSSDLQPGKVDLFPGQDRLKEAMDLFLSFGPRKERGSDMFIIDCERCYSTEDFIPALASGVAKWQSPLEDELLLYHFKDESDEIGMHAQLPRGQISSFVNDLEVMLDSILNDYKSQKKASASRQKGAIKKAMTAFEEKVSALAVKDGDKKKSLHVKHPQLSAQVRAYLDNAATDVTEHAIGGPKAKVFANKPLRDQYEKILDEFEAKLKRYTESADVPSPGLQKSGKKIVAKHVDLFLSQHPYLTESMSEPGSTLNMFFTRLREQLPRDLYAITKEDTTEHVLGQKVWDKVGSNKHLMLRYKPRIFVDRSEQESPLIAIVEEMTAEVLRGSLRYKLKEHGGDSDEILTSHNYLRSGLMSKARDGILVFKGDEALENKDALAQMIAAADEGKIKIIANQLYEGWAFSHSCDVPVNPRFVIVGTHEEYARLYSEVPGFAKHFTISAWVDPRVKATPSTIEVVGKRTRNEFQKAQPNLLVEKEAVERLLEEALRYGGDQSTITSDFSFLSDLVKRTIAETGASPTAERKHVELALAKLRRAVSMEEQKNADLAKRNVYPINITKNVVGLVNVMFYTGEYQGSIQRGSASVFVGQPGIENIDDLVEYTGSAHQKSMYSIEAFVRSEMTRRDIIFPYNVALSHEQNHDDMDGDSAGLVFTMALLSALADQEMYGNIAATGAIGRRGEVQPIGGVNEKIEAYYNVLKVVTDEFSGEYKDAQFKVVIPEPNVSDLMLHREVMHALHARKLQIFPVTNYKEAIPLFFPEPQKLFSNIKSRAEHAKKLYLNSL